MRPHRLWALAILVIAGLACSACAQAPATSEKVAPAQVEPIEGTDLKRVVLTEKAAQRLNIQTVPLQAGPVVRTRTVGGEVIDPPGGASPGPGKVWVRIFITENELSQVNQSQPALVRSLDDADAGGLTAEVDEGPGVDDPEDEDSAEAALYFVVDNADGRLAPGQRVLVELTVSRTGTRRIIIPYSAVIYDTRGGTWVYTTNPESRTFVRQPIVIDYIEGDLAFLSVGPPSSAWVVTVGGAELYGAETGVSK